MTFPLKKIAPTYGYIASRRNWYWWHSWETLRKSPITIVFQRRVFSVLDSILSLQEVAGKLPIRPEPKKMAIFLTDFLVEIFLHRAPRGLGSISHILCYFFFCRCLPHSEYLHKCHIFTQVSQYLLHKSVTYLDIFTQNVTSTLRYYVTHNKYQMVPVKNYEGPKMSPMMHSFVPLLLSDNEHPMQNWHSRPTMDTMKS